MRRELRELTRILPTMSDLLYKDEVFRLIGLCMEIHRELGRGHNEVIYKDALMIELKCAGIPFTRERKYEVAYKGVPLPHCYCADFLIWEKILFEAKAIDKLTESHTKQVLNYLAASKLQLGLLANFGADSLDWKRVVLSRQKIGSIDLQPAGKNSRQFA
jgi:GxxExxY protein